jgi:1-pyrroline-5-carboxylate dehydrogenase
MADSFRVTYATLTADNDELHAAFDQGIKAVREGTGAPVPFVVDGARRDGRASAELEVRSPSDRDELLGVVATASDADVADAVGAAASFTSEWAASTWQERVAVLRRAADLISERRFELAALMGMEIGKNRLETLGDVEETADLIRYYCHDLEQHEGYEQPMGRLSDAEDTFDVMRPHGVWGVISPFNFPMALAIAPASAALAAGNTVVLKPSEQGAITSLAGCEALWDAGVPAGALHVVTGPGEQVGRTLARDPRLDGITFTGSYDVGMEIYRSFSSGPYPRPVICEMGGKNPVIVTENADLDIAAEGTARSAFGLSGQKCSAASRAYVARPVLDDFLGRLVERAEALSVGDPLEQGVFMGPVVDEAAVDRYVAAVSEAERDGSVHTGRRRLDDGAMARGCFVAPTVVTVPRDSRLFRDELFVPLIAVSPVDSLDEAISLANDTRLGLTAGVFSEDESEVDRFLAGIEAGVVYVNRRAGATTGAWPGIQPFGGWKGSGTGGKGGGGPYYMTQYLREQSRTIVR